MTALPHVTDHAVLRYLERVQGFDIEAVRRAIALKCKGATVARSVLSDGFSYMIKNGTVVTIRPTQAQNPRRVPRERVYAEAAE